MNVNSIIAIIFRKRVSFNFVFNLLTYVIKAPKLFLVEKSLCGNENNLLALCLYIVESLIKIKQASSNLI